MSRPKFDNLRDKPQEAAPLPAIREPRSASNDYTPPPSRQKRKAIAGYFSPQMSLALHTVALREGRSLQAVMAEAFNDLLRKYGESPIGD